MYSTPTLTKLSTMRTIFASVAFLLCICCQLTAVELNTNWPKWRGPLDRGSVESGPFAVKFGPKNVAWKRPLPGKGCSTPIVWNKRIYVTAPVDGRDALVAFDWSGKQLWKTDFGKEYPGKHRNGSGCNPSPTTDGKGIFVNFKSGTLAAVNLDGKIRWQTNLVDRYGKDTLFWDHGTSPVLTSKFVVMARMHKGESWLAAFDKVTGELKWKVPRNYKTPIECDHGYSTPLVIRHQGQESLLVWGAQHLTIHSAKDGKVVWSCGDFNPSNKRLWPAISTPVIVNNVAVIAYGRNDRKIPRLHGIKLTGRGDITKTNRIWKREDVGTFVPSPIAYKGSVYLVGDQGRVDCIDPLTGKSRWTDRFPKHRAKFYGSPLIAGGKMYAPREDGMVFVADISDGFKLLAKNHMKESVIASPVPVGNRLFIRSIHTLFCVE